MKKIKIFCTLGPKSLNKKFLKFVNNKIDLVRLNLSHIDYSNLKNIIKFVKKNTRVPICIDTEGAQIRTKVKKNKKFSLGKKEYIHLKNKNFTLYPDNIFHKLKKNDILDIGFDGLKIKLLKIYSDKILFKTIRTGSLENNKGVHISNRIIKLNFLTDKDHAAIELSKKLGIRNFALSFTNSVKDINKFNKILPKENKIFKIETKKAIKSLDQLFKNGKNFLIDRGDLSKEISIYRLPKIQRIIFKKANKRNEVYLATNFLESMVMNPLPNRGEVNDIYNSCEMGASGLVLAGETAIGNYPIECVKFLKKFISNLKLN
jgi:pyruvate kinase